MAIRQEAPWPATADAGSGGALLRCVLGGQRRRLAAASVFFAGHQGGEALIPLLIGVIIDRAVADSDVAALLLWLGVLGVVFAVLSLSWRAGIRRARLSALRAEQQVRVDTTARVSHPTGGPFSERLPGELVNVATDDATRLGMVCFGLPPAVSALVGVTVAGAALLVISVPLGLLVLLATPVVLALLHLLSRPLERRSGVEQAEAGQASGIAADLVAGLRVLKGAGTEEQARQRYRDASQISLAATLSATRAQARYKGAFLAANGLLLAVIALVGGLLALRGEVSPGGFVAAVGLAQYLLAPQQVIGWFTGVLARGRASAQRLAEVLSAPPAVVPGTAGLPEPLLGEVRLRGVWQGTLAGLELTAHPGELLGVVADPADAAALLACLGRDVDPWAGRVELDGVCLTALDPQDVRSAILVTAHHAALFGDSVAANVGAAAPAGTDLGPAMGAAQADEVAHVQPDGASSVVGEGGRSLSGGQRQRLVLARSLAADPSVLVLHDPATAVDAVTGSRIAEGLRACRRGRTTILVVSSPALLAVTDRVVMLEGGRVAVEGTHAGLAGSYEPYRRAVLA